MPKAKVSNMLWFFVGFLFCFFLSYGTCTRILILRVKQIYLIFIWVVDIKDENNAVCSSEVKSNTGKTLQVYLLSLFFKLQSGPDNRGFAVCRFEQI